MINYDSNELKRSRTSLIFQAAFEWLIAILIQSTFLAEVAKGAGFTDSEIGVLNSVIALGCLFQVLSLVPGTSRSGATILGAMILGCSRGAAAEFSFFLGIPTMFGASLLKLVKFGFSFTGGEVFLLIFGMVVAFLVSVYSIKFLMSYIRRNDFKVFGYYRIVLGILVLIYFLVKLIVG